MSGDLMDLEFGETAKPKTDDNAALFAFPEPDATPAPAQGSGEDIFAGVSLPSPADSNPFGYGTKSADAGASGMDGFGDDSFSGGGNGGKGYGGGGASSGAVNNVQPVPQGQPAPNEFGPALYHIQFYQQFFDVDTKDILYRLGMTFVFWKPKFFEIMGDKPDLYVPIWATTTLAFALAAAGNLSQAIMHTNSAIDYTYSFTYLSYAAIVVYSYSTIAPLVFWGVFWGFSVPISFLQLLSMYGYAIFQFIPAMFIAIIPSEIVRWIVIMAAWGTSSLFLTLNFWNHLRFLEKQAALIIVVCIVLLHLALTLSFKLYFFAAFQIATT